MHARTRSTPCDGCCHGRSCRTADAATASSGFTPDRSFKRFRPPQALSSFSSFTSSAAPLIADDTSCAYARACIQLWLLPLAVRQRGVSLLEVMVAVLVLAVGVLGAATLQLSAIRYNASAGYSTQASLIASDLLDRMRANSEQLGKYATASVADQCTASEGGPDIAARDVADFVESVSCHLPAGAGSIAISDNRVTITISWSEARTVAGEEDTRFVTSTVVN